MKSRGWERYIEEEEEKERLFRANVSRIRVPLDAFSTILIRRIIKKTKNGQINSLKTIRDVGCYTFSLERGEDEDGHVYRGRRRRRRSGGKGRTRKRVISDRSGELLRWMPDNKLLQDQFLEFEESWPSCGKKMRGRRGGGGWWRGEEEDLRWRALRRSPRSSNLPLSFFRNYYQGRIAVSFYGVNLLLSREVTHSRRVNIPSRFEPLFSYSKCAQRENCCVVYSFLIKLLN